MISFEEIVKDIYLKMISIKGEGRLPYYLFMSKETYSSMKNEICKNTTLFPNGRFEYFEGMEVVPLNDVPLNHIEVKGLKLKDA